MFLRLTIVKLLNHLIFIYLIKGGRNMNRKLIGILICLTMMMPVISISVIANGAPSTPTIEGPSSGKPGFIYDYTFMSIDPDGDDIFFMISWGCCGPGQDFHTYGPFESGEEAVIEKGYSEEGTFSIQAYAKDMEGAESDKVILEVTMPKNNAVTTENDEDKIFAEKHIIAFGTFSHCETNEVVYGYVLIGFMGSGLFFNANIEICDDSIQSLTLKDHFLNCVYICDG
jgi:hypothetical protein